MASLTKRSDSKFWIACFTAQDGRQLKRSTGIPWAPAPGEKTKAAELKRKAQEIAQDFEAAARAVRTARQTREVIADLHERITGEVIVKRTPRALIAEWLIRKKPEVTEQTHLFYTSSSSQFLTFIGTAADMDFAYVTRDLITRYRNDLAAKLSSATANHHLGVVKQFITDARRDGRVTENPAEFVDKVSRKSGVKVVDSKPRRPFTKSELTSVLGACTAEWRSMVIFGIYTGQRLGDLSLLRWSYIQDGVLRFVASKTGRQMQIPIAKPLADHIATIPRDPKSEFIHSEIAKLAPSTRSGQFADILATAGLRAAQAHRHSHGNGRGAGRVQHELSFHCLRHTAVTLLKEAGVPLAVVMEIIGHDSEAVSQLYTHIGTEAMADGIAKMPNITGTAA